MIKKPNVFVAAFALFASTSSFAAEGSFLPIEKVVATLADGKAWSAETPDGKTIKIIFNADSTGSIRGPVPIPLSLTWTVDGELLCIKTKMATPCLRFTQVSGGLQGWKGGKKDLKLTR